MDRTNAANRANAHDGDEPIAASADDVRNATARNALDRVTNLEVDGVVVHGPTEGFGPLWRKRYWVRLTGSMAAPVEIVRIWRERFGDFWPGDNEFFGPLGALDPGDIGLLELEMPGGVRLSSGVYVMDVRPESFTLITPDGHVLAGVITFSAYRSEGIPVAQIEIVFQAGDPLFEIGLRLFGHRREDAFWQDVLRALARHVGSDAEPEMHAQLLDRRFQWSQAGNITSNALIRNGLFRSAAPVTWVARRARQRFRGGAKEDRGE